MTLKLRGFEFPKSSLETNWLIYVVFSSLISKCFTIGLIRVFPIWLSKDSGKKSIDFSASGGIIKKYESPRRPNRKIAIPKIFIKLKLNNKECKSIRLFFFH